MLFLCYAFIENLRLKLVSLQIKLH